MNQRRLITTDHILFPRCNHLSESSEIHVPPDFPEDLNILELQDEQDWKLADLVLPSAQRDEIKNFMQKRNALSTTRGQLSLYRASNNWPLNVSSRSSRFALLRLSSQTRDRRQSAHEGWDLLWYSVGFHGTVFTIFEQGRVGAVSSLSSNRRRYLDGVSEDLGWIAWAYLPLEDGNEETHCVAEASDSSFEQNERELTALKTRLHVSRSSLIYLQEIHCSCGESWRRIASLFEEIDTIKQRKVRTSNELSSVRRKLVEYQADTVQ